MFFMFTHRVVKVNTGSREKFAPRSANETRWTVSGPFVKRAEAERAALAALATHTCLDAQVWTEEAVRELHGKGYSTNGRFAQELLTQAVRLIA